VSWSVELVRRELELGGVADGIVQPIVCGVPLARGLVKDPGRLRAVSCAGDAQTVQHNVLDRWPDGSVRWMTLDWLAHQGVKEYRVEPGLDSRETERDSFRIERTDTGLTIGTGAAVFHLGRGEAFPITQVYVDGVGQLERPASLIVTPARLPLSFGLPQVTRCGSVRTEVMCTSWMEALQVRVFMSFFAGTRMVQVRVEITNTAPAAHPRGIWTLGSRGAVHLDDLSLMFFLRGTAGTSFIRPERSIQTREGDDLSLYQDSSGGENWQSPVHLNRDSQVMSRFRGYRMDADGEVTEGLRAAPVAGCYRASGRLGLTLATVAFWENFPKSLSVCNGVVRYGLFPGEFADSHEIQGGERKAHDLWLDFAPEHSNTLDWVSRPDVFGVSPEDVCRSGAVPYLTPLSAGDCPEYLELINGVFDPLEGVEAKREAIDEYGWRNFGELYADHESKFHGGDDLFISHYNNQYDGVAGFAINYLRSGDRRWLDYCHDLARHIVDIDIYHTTRDRAAYNHGLFWHTAHYVTAERATHRTFPESMGEGGGPSPEHVYTRGLLLHYYLTGEETSRDAVIALGQFVIDADDGSKTIFRYLDSGRTGNASWSGTEFYHGPGRGCGNGIAALSNAFKVSGERKFLTKSEELIRRCIHPHDDLVARDLYDVDERWFYMVMLRSIVDYLDIKAELGEIDAQYAYAQASLIHYADWAANNEYPYLDKPEILEYATETWIGQDMRKSDVLYLAARHVDGERRAFWRQRAKFFYENSAKTLLAEATRHWSRPMVLILTQGWIAPWFESHPEYSAPKACQPDTYGEIVHFVTQKNRVKRLLKKVVAASVVFVSAAVTIGLAVWVPR
jgi:hypothetical protein